MQAQGQALNAITLLIVRTNFCIVSFPCLFNVKHPTINQNELLFIATPRLETIFRISIGTDQKVQIILTRRSGDVDRVSHQDRYVVSHWLIPYLLAVSIIDNLFMMVIKVNRAYRKK